MQISRYEAEKPLLLFSTWICNFAKNLHQINFKTFERHRQIQINQFFWFYLKRSLSSSIYIKYNFLLHLYVTIVVQNFTSTINFRRRRGFVTSLPQTHLTAPHFVASLYDINRECMLSRGQEFPFTFTQNWFKGVQCTGSIDFSVESPWNIRWCQVSLVERYARPNSDGMLKICRTEGLIAFNASWHVSARSSRFRG